MLGNGRLEAYCIDGKSRQCHIRGKMRKKVWVAAGDIILISLREYQVSPPTARGARTVASTAFATPPPPLLRPLLWQDDKADVILKYTADEARELKSDGELPADIAINEGVAEGGDGAGEEGGFEFGDASSGEDSDGESSGGEVDVDAI
jgi:translation initiation factor 1A